MKKEEVMQIILKRINFRQGEDTSGYDGLNMSGYNNSVYSNLELIAKFNDLLNINCGDENRQELTHIPLFWKGMGRIVKTDQEGKSEVIEELEGGETTPNILFKILTLQNPRLLD